MNSTHPNSARAVAILAAMLSLCAAGCRNTQTGLAANPFMAPNRVPPPATRALLPGQAQPYYPGDPLPVMQSNAAQPAATRQIAAASESEMPSATEHLSWTSPSGRSATPPAEAVAPSAVATEQSIPPSSSTVAANEPSIAIPDDGNALRFAMPAAAPAAPAAPRPFVPSAPVGLASNASPIAQPAQLHPQQPAQLQPQQPTHAIAAAQPPVTQAVQQATYTEPVIPTAPVEATSPWRTPRISAATLPSPPSPSFGYSPALATLPVQQPPAMVPPTLPPTAPQPIVMANMMDVRLRAVPSPPIATASTAPRIRIPGSETAPMLVGSNDGFRPRGSMR